MALGPGSQCTGGGSKQSGPGGPEVRACLTGQPLDLMTGILMRREDTETHREEATWGGGRDQSDLATSHGVPNVPRRAEAGWTPPALTSLQRERSLLTLNSQSPELWRSKSLLFQQPSLWHFAAAAWGHQSS